VVKQDFINSVSAINKGILLDLDTNVLNNLINEYPCFNSAYILQAIALKKKSEEEFQDALPKIAVRVLNRAVLYDRVTFNYTKPIADDSQIIEKDTPSKDKVDLTESSLADNNNNKKEKPLLNAIVEKEKDISEVDENKIKEEVLLEDEKANTSKIATSEEAKIDNELEGILKQSEVDEKEKLPKTTLTPQEELEDLNHLIEEVKAKSKRQAIVSKVEKTTQKIEKPKAKVVEQKTSSNENMSFSEWLKNKKSIDKTPKKVHEEIVEEIPIDISASHEAALIMESKKSSFKLEDFLVDQIERKQEKKEKGKNSFTHAVSETYAKILANQGKIKEAIDVYKELSIKYPKKSSNFTIQIEKLKNSL